MTPKEKSALRVVAALVTAIALAEVGARAISAAHWSPPVAVGAACVSGVVVAVLVAWAVL